MAEQEEPQASPRAQIKRLLGVLLRAFKYWPVMVIAATIAVGAGALAPTIFVPIYSSETVLLYQQVIQARSVVGRDSAETGLGKNGGMRVREMLLSRTNLEIIVKELDLYPSTVASLGMIEAIDELRRNASCDVGRADTFTISFQSTDPELTFRVTRRLADSLIEQGTHYRADQAESTQSFLQAQQQRTQKDLSAKEQKLAIFLAGHPEFAQNPAGSSSPGASIRADEAARANRNLGLAPLPTTVKPTGDPRVLALERQAARIRAQLADDGSDSAPIVVPAPVGVVDPQMQLRIQQAEAEVVRARRRLLEARASKTDNHPDVVAARARLRVAETSANALKANAAVPAPAPPPPRARVVLSGEDRQKLRHQLASIRNAIRKAGGAVNVTGDAVVDGGASPSSATSTAEGDRIVALETEWTTLTRDVNDVRERNAGLQRLLFNANIIATIESSGEAAQMIFIDPPYKPARPSKRGSRRVGAIAVAVVFLLGVGLAVVFAFLDDRVYDAQDVQGLHIGKLTHVVAAAEKGKQGRAAKGKRGAAAKGKSSDG